LGSVDPKADQVIPVVSRQTHERAEGYFRLEWKLAVDRSHFIVANKAFLLPVVIDDTRDDDENVPEKFREVHWTRLPDGDTPPDAGYDRPEKKSSFALACENESANKPSRSPQTSSAGLLRIAHPPATSAKRGPRV
jgi:hypothetical protein